MILRKDKKYVGKIKSYKERDDIKGEAKRQRERERERERERNRLKIGMRKMMQGESERGTV